MSPPCFLAFRKLIGAQFFGDGYASNSGATLSSLVDKCGDFLSPRDIDGHGSHTASTAGGSVVSSAVIGGMNAGSPRGVAYGSRLSVYKVFWCGDGAQDSDIIAAVEAGVADGVDVLSLSLGNVWMPKQ